MKKIFSILIILVLIVGCGSINPIKPVSKKIWPLKVGNRWEYLFTLEYLSYIDSSIYSESRTYTSEIIGEAEVNDEIWYHIEDKYIFPDSVIETHYWYWAERENGLWCRYSPTAEPELYIEYPLSEGEITQFWGPDYEVVGINDSLMTPAGQFTCYHLFGSGISEDSIRSWVAHFYFNPRVGILRDYSFWKFPSFESHDEIILTGVILK